MPRRKGWKWSETKRKEWRERLRADGRRKAETERGKQWTKVDDGDGTVMDRERRGTDCDDDVTLSPPNVVQEAHPTWWQEVHPTWWQEVHPTWWHMTKANK